MRWTRRSTRLRHLVVPMIAIVLPITACSRPPEPGDVGATGGSGEGSCAFVVTFRGETYVGRQAIVQPEPGDFVGNALMPGCSDSGESPEPDEEISVVELPGVHPDVAVVWNGNPGTILVREDVDPLPPEVQRYFESPACDPEDEPVELFGRWLGILAPDQETELDLVPPYDLEILVRRASSATYERADLFVRVSASAGRPLTREDIRTSLWEGGFLRVTARCADDGFVADDVTAYPG